MENTRNQYHEINNITELDIMHTLNTSKISNHIVNTVIHYYIYSLTCMFKYR